MTKFFYNFRPNDAEFIFDDGNFANFCVFHGYPQISKSVANHWLNFLRARNANCWTFNPALINWLDENDKSIDVLLMVGEEKKEEVSFRRIPHILKKLPILGIGEALCDTDLTKIGLENIVIA